MSMSLRILSILLILSIIFRFILITTLRFEMDTSFCLLIGSILSHIADICCPKSDRSAADYWISECMNVFTQS
jgi:hypothetical protein